jgi:ribosomal protein S18 acetylase RimI-like enzyme
MHVLDNPGWHALMGAHAPLGERNGSAARYQPDVAAFCALADEAAPAAWNDLRDLVGAGGVAIMARNGLAVPDGWNVEFTIPCRQMVLPDGAGDDGGSTREPLLVLEADDVPEMLALVERTRPGPFARRTIELGSYLGVRHGGTLVAMAGERMRPPGYTEISAVCTDADQRGRGLASQLIRALVRSIRSRSETPFLHLTTENETAYRLYETLGFETRALFDVVALRVP